MRKLSLAVAALALLGACSTTPGAAPSLGTNAASLSAQISGLCPLVQQSAAIAGNTVKGGAANTVADISTYVTAACATQTAIAALAQNQGTVDWLNQLQGGLGALTAAAKAPS